MSAAKVKILTDLFRLPLDYFYDAPGPCAPGPATPRRAYLNLVQNLQRIERDHPAAFTALCRLIAALGENGRV